MQPETPILMITLHIPVDTETNADQILDVIGDQLRDALNEFKHQQRSGSNMEDLPRTENAYVSPEAQESTTADTQRDVLANLGYRYSA